MSQTEQPLALRPDLIWREISLGSQSLWVVKDPFVAEYHYLSEREREILQLIDGKRSIQQILNACQTRLAPQHLSAESLVSFLAEIRRRGLILCAGGEPSKRQSQAAWWRNPFAVRLPGVAVGGLLSTIAPQTADPQANKSETKSRINRWSLIVFVLVTLLVVIAAAVALLHFDDIATQVSLATSRSLAKWGWMLVLVIATTKVIHELSHAFVCHRLGAECRQIGVMLLFGIPVLYCDVSDAWLLKERWKRIAVSAAGMAAELVIAAVATFVWLFSENQLLSDLCVTVMVVCSISTLLFNGNPLLRYDGYYIASDLVGVPNLSQQSAATARSFLRRIVWGSFDSSDGVRKNQIGCERVAPWALFAYWCVSLCYKTIVFTAIAWFVYQIAARARLGFVIAAAILLLCGFAMVVFCKPILTPPIRRRRQAWGQWRRPLVITACLGLALAVVLIAPLPQRVRAPIVIRPANASEVFVRHAGRIIDAIEPGCLVQPGQVLARLANPDLQLQRSEVATEVQQFQAELTNLTRLRPANAETLARIPVLTKTLLAAQKRQSMLAQDASWLTVPATQAGQVFAAAIHKTAPVDRHQVVFSRDTPLSPQHRGAWLEAGETLCLIGDPGEYEALAFVAQDQVERLRIGQSVAFRIANQPRGLLTGQLIEVAASPAEELPPPIASRNWIDSASPTITQGGKEPVYFQVRIAINPQPANLLVDSVGYALIEVDRSSLLQRFRNWLRAILIV